MKRVSVFIASSAELAEDKQMFDLYFSEKNKLYRPKGIDFDQRTWMDFNSSINREGRLQDRYNSFIKECDIAIFLFHTRIGKYTVEELETAYRTLQESRTSKPRIYIYFKDDGTAGESLKDFRLYCEQKLGHFCDTYSNSDDLLRKFDRQLVLLENEKFISAPGKAEKMRQRFVFTLSYVAAPLVVLTVGYLLYYYYTPASSTVRLQESHQSSLPFKGAELTLQYADKTEKATFRDLSDEIVFKGIHRRYLGKEAHVTISAPGYVYTDSTIRLSANHTFTISRDQSLAVIYGTVKDEDNSPIGGASIRVLDLTAVSDLAGNFRIEIPEDRQRTEQRVEVFKDGYQLWDFTAPVSSEIPWKIILRRK